jgi:hypothetical protein
MKISLSKFYKEVTGTSTVNRATTTAALARWGVPFDDNTAKSDVVDIVHLASATATHAAEKAAREAARPARNGNGAAHASTSRLGAVEVKLDAVAATVFATHDRADAIDGKLDSIIKKLATMSKPTRRK